MIEETQAHAALAFTAAQTINNEKGELNMADAKGLKLDTRRKEILDILARDGQVRVSSLAQTLNASVVTIRSDLSALEADGYLERVSGGAVQTVKNFYNLDFQRRKQENIEMKKQIAIRAASLVSDGETLMINSGTTTYLTAVELKKRKNLNIVTNSLNVAMELGAVPTFRVILLGGDINVQYSFVYGADAAEQLNRYKAERCILSVDGVCDQWGLTTYHAEESLIDRKMMERSRETMIVADSSKLGHESFATVCELNRAHIWVTDEGADDASVDDIMRLGLRVLR